MQYVNHDMDDMFRKAAENFRLKDGRDWDKVSASLHKPNPTPLPKSKGSGRLPILIIITLLSLTTALTFLPINEKSGPAVHSDIIQTKIQPGPDRNVLEHIAQKISSPGNNVSKQHRLNIALRLKKSRILNHDVSSSIKNELILTSERQKIKADNTDQDQKSQNLAEQITKDILMEANPVHSSLLNEENKIQKEIIFNTQGDQIQSPTTNIPVQSIIRTKGLYAGLFAGPQVNQVEGQGYNKIGLSIGLIAGYSFNKNLSLEGGLFYSQKHYYSDGKYFEMKKGTMPSGMKVINLESSADILEIPVKLKYDFLQKSKGSFFITAGLSSYILARENNLYFALINGFEQDINAVYTERKTYLAGALNVSAGYTFRLQKKSGIRIEPYVQIPFRGTGVGSMRVMTTGIHFGVTHNFHR